MSIAPPMLLEPPLIISAKFTPLQQAAPGAERTTADILVKVPTLVIKGSPKITSRVGCQSQSLSGTADMVAWAELRSNDSDILGLRHVSAFG